MKIYLMAFLLLFFSTSGNCQQITVKKNVIIGLFENKQEFKGFLTGIADDIDSLFKNFLLANSSKNPFGNYDSSKISILKPVISSKENEASLKIETSFIVVDLLKKAIWDDCNAVLNNIVNLNFSTDGKHISVIQDVLNNVSYSSICLGSKRKKQILESKLPTNSDFNNFIDNLNKVISIKLDGKISAIKTLSNYNSQYLTFSDLVFSIESINMNKENIFLTIVYSFKAN